MLQELLASTLDIEVGSYHHVATSLHLYKHHLDLAKSILASPESSDFEMPRMMSPEQLPCFLAYEFAIRGGGGTADSVHELAPYWGDMVKILNIFALLKRFSINNEIIEHARSSPYYTLLCPILWGERSSESRPVSERSAV